MQDCPTHPRKELAHRVRVVDLQQHLRRIYLLLSEATALKSDCNKSRRQSREAATLYMLLNEVVSAAACNERQQYLSKHLLRLQKVVYVGPGVTLAGGTGTEIAQRPGVCSVVHLPHVKHDCAR